MYMKGQLSLVEVSEEGKRSKAERKSLCSQVKERITKYGVGTILDEEILSVLSDIPLEKIKSFIEEYGEIGELYKNIDLLKVTETQKKKLLMIFDFSKRAKYVGKSKVTLDSSSKTGSYMMDLLSMKRVEEFIVISLNSQNQIIKTVTASVGTINEAPIHAREIARTALLNNAVSVVVGHNHPGGSLRASSADTTATKAIKAALEMLNIKLLDHVIVNDIGYISFAEQGLL